MASKHFGTGRESGYAGIAFWINKEHDVALYLMLKACIASPGDLLLLNNFASCLSMIGLPERAIPILDYVNKKLPNNANVFSNLGNSWLSLGDVTKATPLLEKAVAKDDAHPEANRSLARISLKESNKTKASNYLGKSMTGGFDQKTYNAWRELSPGKDVAAFIRPNHKMHYKEVPITKRWMLPEIPSSVKDAQEKEPVIKQFFANIEATVNDMSSKITDLQNSNMEKQGQQVMKMKQQVESMKSLDDVQRYNNEFGVMMHPLKAQAQLMLTAIRSSDYATSYSQRIAQAEKNRSARLSQFNNSIKPLNTKIAALRKESDALEGGEHGDDEVKMLAISKQICSLNRQIQSSTLSSQAEINTQYMKQVEDILNQRLQEETYWTALYTLPADPTGAIYDLYEDYLRALSGFHNLYPMPAPSEILCDDGRDDYKSLQVTGKLQQWEDAHCPIDIDINIKLVQASMNCREIKLAGKIEGIKVEWERKIDVVTWETLEHSISISGGLGEYETSLTDQLKGKAGLDGKVTIKLGEDLIPTDLIIKAEGGVELSGPMGGKAGADMGSLEISIQGGLRGDGSVPDLVGKMFGAE
jgi:tetratricopeptide (TPR) repeat protein